MIWAARGGQPKAESTPSNRNGRIIAVVILINSLRWARFGYRQLRCRFRASRARVENRRFPSRALGGLHPTGACAQLHAPLWFNGAAHFARYRRDSALVFSTGLRYQSRMSNDTIDRLARTLADSVPQGLRSMREDLEKNFRTILKGGLGRLDLVTREEFEVQEAVLRRTRAKLEALEVRLASLEAGASKRAPTTAGPQRKKAPRKKAPKKS